MSQPSSAFDALCSDLEAPVEHAPMAAAKAGSVKDITATPTRHIGARKQRDAARERDNVATILSTPTKERFWLVDVWKAVDWHEVFAFIAWEVVTVLIVVFAFIAWEVVTVLIVVLAVSDWIYFFRFVVEPMDPSVRMRNAAVWAVFTVALVSVRRHVRSRCGHHFRSLADHAEIFVTMSLIMVFAINIAFYLHVPSSTPLRDLGFMLIPAQAEDSKLRPLSDIMTISLPIVCMVQSYFMTRENRCRVMAAFFRVATVSYALRTVTTALTSLPGPAPHCRPGNPQYAPPQTWIDVVTRVGPMYGQFFSCGDLIFSGHMAYTNSALLVYLRTLDRNFSRFSRLRWFLGVCYLSTLAVLCIAGRKHYTVDIVLGIMISTLVFFHFEHSWIPVALQHPETYASILHRYTTSRRRRDSSVSTPERSSETDECSDDYESDGYGYYATRMTPDTVVVMPHDIATHVLMCRGVKGMKREQSIQSEAPRGIVLLLGTKDILRQPTAIINKNMAKTDTQSVVRDTVISPTSNDVVTLSGASKVADAVLPASAVKIGQIKSETEIETETESSEAKTEAEIETEAEPQYRVAFMYPKSGDTSVLTTNVEEETEKKKKTKKGKEQWGLGLGWRYPLGWWNMYGADKSRSRSKALALGVYFASLLEYWLRYCPTLRPARFEVGKQIVSATNQTLGQLKFLFRLCGEDDDFADFHVESSVKFFLLHPEEQTSEAMPHRLEHFVGPHLGENLAWRVQEVARKLDMCRGDSVQRWLQEHYSDNVQSRVVLRGLQTNSHEQSDESGEPPEDFVEPQEGVSLYQLAVEDEVFVVDVQTLGTQAQAPLELIWSEPDVFVLVGFCVTGDLRRLHRSFPLLFAAPHLSRQLVELKQLAYYRRLPASKWGLAQLYDVCMGDQLDKEEQCSDWSRRPLSSSQVVYAAKDAFVVRNITAFLLADVDDWNNSKPSQGPSFLRRFAVVTSVTTPLNDGLAPELGHWINSFEAMDTHHVRAALHAHGLTGIADAIHTVADAEKPGFVARREAGLIVKTIAIVFRNGATDPIQGESALARVNYAAVVLPLDASIDMAELAHEFDTEAGDVMLADRETLIRVFGYRRGGVGPIGLREQSAIRVVLDASLRAERAILCGAGQEDVVNIPKEDMLALGKCTLCSRPYEPPADEAESAPVHPASATASKPKRKRWVELKSKRGRTYYHNTETGEDTWEKPADIDADAVEDGFVPFKNDAMKNAVLREQAKADATKMGLPPTLIAAMQARQQEHDSVEDPFDKMLNQPSATPNPQSQPRASPSPRSTNAHHPTLVATFAALLAVCRADVQASEAQDCRVLRCDATDNTPVCGSDGNTYRNQCLFEFAKCRHSKLKIAHHRACEDVVIVKHDAESKSKLSVHVHVTKTSEKNTTKPAAKECNDFCSRELEPVCASDKKTYNNMCLFEAAQCRNPKLTLVNADGPCENLD
ncbi:hypothetical protein P43SY_000496 [Pythium insidiosum]|uniref:Uncharacterized protein n=1 Tax=Pythium insidiosum TaxID=114742 RepID=A0AAD5M3A5_PYTIN|nr:hypothetical protein P43SY_000496 [Pythium insidiosum]